jgi:hypothetical protein
MPFSASLAVGTDRFASARAMRNIGLLVRSALKTVSKLGTALDSPIDPR